MYELTIPPLPTKSILLQRRLHHEKAENFHFLPKNRVFCILEHLWVFGFDFRAKNLHTLFFQPNFNKNHRNNSNKHKKIAICARLVFMGKCVEIYRKLNALGSRSLSTIYENWHLLQYMCHNRVVYVYMRKHNCLQFFRRTIHFHLNYRTLVITHRCCRFRWNTFRSGCINDWENTIFYTYVLQFVYNIECTRITSILGLIAGIHRLLV